MIVALVGTMLWVVGVLTPRVSSQPAALRDALSVSSGVEVDGERPGGAVLIELHNDGDVPVRLMSATFQPDGDDDAGVRVLQVGSTIDDRFYSGLGPIPVDVPSGRGFRVALLLSGPCDWRSSWGDRSVGEVSIGLRSVLGIPRTVTSPVVRFAVSDRCDPLDTPEVFPHGSASGPPTSEVLEAVPADRSAAEAAIRTSFDTAYRPAATGEERAAAVSDPTGVTDAFTRALAGGSGATVGGAEAAVTDVRFLGDGEAEVDYLVRGPNIDVFRRGRANLVGGTWKVARDTVCADLEWAGAPCQPPPMR